MEVRSDEIVSRTTPFAGDLSPSALKGAVQNSPGREPRGD